MSEKRASRTKREARAKSALKEEYKQYTIGLALFDMVPVLLFLACGLILWSMYAKPLFLAGVIASFIGGTCKALWKLIVVVGKRDRHGLTTAFHILLPGGFVLMLLSVVIDVSRDSLAGAPLAEGSTLSGILCGLSVMPAPLLFLAGAFGMCLMGYLGSRMDESRGANWIEELVNAFSQLAFLAGVVIVYFGMFYPATDAAAAALTGSDSVRVTAYSESFADVSSGDGNYGSGSGRSVGKTAGPATYCFDGPGTESALVFYPGAKVEASAYAPLMLRLAEDGIDCYLCVMPYNFALMDKDAAEKIRGQYSSDPVSIAGKGNDYKRWYLCGHSLGGAAASMMLADEAEGSGGGAAGADGDGQAAWDGIIFLGSYPAEAVSIPVLSIYGSEDRVLNLGKYEQAGTNGLWPADRTEKVIKGGNHAQFGDYGEQDGDGNANITADRQQKLTADAITGFVKK